MSELPQRLKRLAERGEPRGAADVFAAAQADAANPATVATLSGARRARIVVSIAAAVCLVGGIAAAMQRGDDNATKPTGNFAIATTTTAATIPPTTTTTHAPATRVFLASTQLVPFDKCANLANYARTRALDVVGPYGFPYGGYGVRQFSGGVATGAPAARTANDAAGAPGAAAPVASATSESSSDFSTTNVQEAGIDEPDSVKTDGKTIFTVANSKVYATTAGASPSIIDTKTVERASELMLIGKNLIVVSNSSYGYATDARMAPGFAPSPSQALPVMFSVYDVSDPSNMKFTGRLSFNGGYVSSRVVNGAARLVVRSSPNVTFTYPTDGSPAAQEQAAAANRDIIRKTSNDTWVPHFSSTDASGHESQVKQLGTCADTYRPPTLSGFGMLSVITLNAGDPSKSQSTSVMAEGDIVYSSKNRLYVATNSWDNVVNSQVQPSANTLIHSFDIAEASNARYLVSGRVKGTILNQWSLSEYGGVLRVVTTDSNGGTESFLSTLEDFGDSLQQVGQVGGLGKGERVYAVRYIDTNAYVVTFRQVDPLYVIDVSDPKNPRVAGELKISGYSAYLHPVGPGLLLGIGQEATEQGQRVGFAASIFDVRNPAAPKLVARKVVEQAGSSAEFDHHAFLYWPATGLAVVPMYAYGPNGQSFNGAIGLKITEGAIEEIGRIQQPDAPQYGEPIERSLVIGTRLYTTSFRGILSNRLDNLQSLAWVPYPA